MKKFLLILAAVLTGIALYVYLDPRLSRQLENTVRDAVRDTVPGQSPSTQVYKWRNATGQWQITDTPPPAGTPYDTLDYHHDANLMPAEALTGRKPEE